MNEELDMLIFVEILIKHCKPVQIDQILQEISSRHEHDCCPICGSERMLFDKKSGKRLGYVDDVSNAEWHDTHEIDCIVTLIDEMRELRHGN